MAISGKAFKAFSDVGENMISTARTTSSWRMNGGWIYGINLNCQAIVYNRTDAQVYSCMGSPTNQKRHSACHLRVHARQTANYGVCVQPLDEAVYALEASARIWGFTVMSWINAACQPSWDWTKRCPPSPILWQRPRSGRVTMARRCSSSLNRIPKLQKMMDGLDTKFWYRLLS